MALLACTTCTSTYRTSEPIWRCRCGGLLDIIQTPAFDRTKIDYQAPGLWRYRHAIPVENDANIVSLGEGMTPLILQNIGGRPVYFKMDYLQPSGSFKDRGAAVLMSKAKELRVQHIIEDSSGNAGAAIAAYGAAAGISCDIYVPAHTSKQKLAQIKAAGAACIEIPGGREATAIAALHAAEQTYYASHSWNPFFFQGAKTIAFELCEQLGWRAPDIFVAPAGNGTLLLGAALGFSELCKTGVIKNMPKIIAVQAENCAPLATAFAHGNSDFAAVDTAPTQAEGIAVAHPIRGAQILRAVRAGGGEFVTVTEDEISSMLHTLHRRGLYVEPTAAVAAAGVAKQIHNFKTADVVASVFTGHGLKSKV